MIFFVENVLDFNILASHIHNSVLRAFRENVSNVIAHDVFIVIYEKTHQTHRDL